MGREAAASDADVKLPVRRGDSELPPHQPGRRLQTPPPDLRPFRRWAPWLVPVFVVANLVMFALIMYVNDCPKNLPGECVAVFLGRFAFQPLRDNALFGPTSSTLVKLGALHVHKVVEEHQGWRLISCIWLHAGVVHVLANMLSLLLIGIRLEQEFGFGTQQNKSKIGLLYVLSGFGGSLMSALFIKSSISVGASGALFGLLGAMLSELLTNWTIYTNKFAALLTLVLIIVINLAVGILPHVDNFAHVGGFVSGFLLGFVLLIRPQFGWVSQKNVPPGYRASPVKHKNKMYQYILWIIAFILLAVGFSGGLIMLFRGINANEYCSWCHYLSCVPTSVRRCPSSATISCMSSQEGSNLSLTCAGNNRARSYFFPNATEAQIEELCSQLCSS